jgi:hypothetical protein
VLTLLPIAPFLTFGVSLLLARQFLLTLLEIVIRFSWHRGRYIAHETAGASFTE